MKTNTIVKYEVVYEEKKRCSNDYTWKTIILDTLKDAKTFAKDKLNRDKNVDVQINELHYSVSNTKIIMNNNIKDYEKVL